MTKEQDIILSGNKKLTQYSSDLIKKGLSLAKKMQSPELEKAQLFLILAVERLQEGDYESALISFELALMINPDYYEVYVLRSSCIYTPLENHEDIIKDNNQILRLNPKNAEAYTNRGYLYASLGNHLEAIKDYNKALRIKPYSAQTYINRGLSSAALHKYDEAIFDFSQALKINPQNSDAYNNRGISYFFLEDYEDSLDDFDQALYIAHDDTIVYLNRSRTLIGLSEYLEALENIEYAFSLDPECCDQYFERYIQNIDQILKNLDEQVMKILLIHCLHGLTVQGKFRHESKDYYGAIESYTKVLSIIPDNSQAYYGRSTARSELGDFEGAMEDLQKARQFS